MKSTTILKTLAATLFLGAYSYTAQAQISGCSVFLLGKKVEVGVNWNGALGASTNPPTGAHGNWSTTLHTSSSCGNTTYTGISLAAVADPDEDGWSTGATSYYGDFILPGGANEGWSIMYNGEQTNLWNSDAATTDSIPGLFSSVYGYTDTSGKRIAITQAVYNGIYMTQWITLDTNKLFFSVSTLLENTTLATASDVFYMRFVNPHNDQAISSNPATWNRILYQYPPDTGQRAVVTSRGVAYNNAFMALGTKDPSAMAFIAKTRQKPDNTTIDNISTGTDAEYHYNVNDSVNANACMGLIFNVGNLVSGGGALINYFYAFRPDVIDDAIYSSSVGITKIERVVHEYTVFPNPVSSGFKLMGTQPNDQIEVFDMMGRHINHTKTGNYEYSIGDVAAGTYLVMVKSASGLITGRARLQKL